ncbi:MAG: AAA family ATPase [Candidatus Solibacter usitatus]|nr:AAA family ATPase [Candidatus Solibacter usitatus]
MTVSTSPPPATREAPHQQRLLELATWTLAPPGPGAAPALGVPRGVLLSGPPGCGKKYLARTVAEQCSAAFLFRSGVELLHRFHLESATPLAESFEAARTKSPCLLYFDDLDLIAPRGIWNRAFHERALMARMLSELDALQPGDRVLVVGASARPGSLAADIRRRGRLDREVVVPVPDRDARRQILQQLARSMPFDHPVDFENLSRLTSGFTGEDLRAVCQEAAISASRRVPAPAPVTMDDFLAAIRVVEPSAAGELFLELPHTRWSHIGGMDAVKQRLRELVEWPLKHPDLFSRAGLSQTRGVLLTGPPGSGKTMLARAVATESGAGFVALHHALSRLTFENSAAALHEAFRRAGQAAPCILFLDDVDVLLSGPMAHHFHTEMRAVATQRGLVVLGATSHPDRLEPALLGRGALEEVVEIPSPDERERRDILALEWPNGHAPAQADIIRLARSTDGLSGAELILLREQAARRAVERSIQSGVTGIGVEPSDFDQALDEIRRKRRRHFV